MPPSGRALEEEEIDDIMRWRAKALSELEDCTNEQAAVLALDALDRVERARGVSKNLKGDISHDLKVSAAIARHAVLAVCQRSTRFETDSVSRDLIDKLKAECLRLSERTDQLKIELDKQKAGREFLLHEKKQSRRSSPVRAPESCHPHRGQKRDLRERRGEPDPEPPAATSAEAEYDPLVPEIITYISWVAARDEWGPSNNRPLSPMARYAAADPHVMGVLRDISESLRRLEYRVGALKGRPPPAPAPHLGGGGAGTVVATPGPTTRSRRRRRRGRRGSGYPDPPPTVTKQAPKGPVTRARAGPLGPDAAPARTASGRKGTTAVSRVVPPGAAKPPPTKAALSSARGATGKGGEKGGRKKAGTGGGQTLPHRSVNGLRRGGAGPHRRQPEPPRRRAMKSLPVKRRRDLGRLGRLYRLTSRPRRRRGGTRR